MDIYSILSTKPHNPHYLFRYIRFIEGCRKVNSERNSDRTFKHHICPKASDMFPEYKSFNLYPWNRIDLSARQHFIAHVILFRAFRNRSCGYALSNFGMKNSRKYAKDVLEYIALNFHPFRGKTRSDITKRKISNKLSGVPLSEERRHNMSLSRKQWYQTNHPSLGCYQDEKTKEMISNSVKKYHESDLSNDHKNKLRMTIISLNQSPEQRQRVKQVKSKHYVVVSPDNIEYDVFNLSDFCKKYNLSQAHMSSVANGQRTHHKGWLCRHKNGGDDSSAILQPHVV